MKTIAIFCQKGGTGKTTATMAVGAYLQNKGKSVLYIDADAQQNLSFTMKARTGGDTLHSILHGTPAADVIQHTEQGDIIPASKNLSVSPWNDNQVLNYKRHNIDLRESLKTALKGLPADYSYDYCIVDLPPALNEVSTNGLFAADDVIIPVRADLYSINALKEMKWALAAAKENNKKLKVAGVIVTAYNKRSLIQQKALELIEEQAKEYKTKVYTVRQSIAITESQALQNINFYRYAPKVSAVLDYSNIMDEIEGRL